MKKKFKFFVYIILYVILILIMAIYFYKNGSVYARYEHTGNNILNIIQISKVANLKPNRLSKIAITLTSSTFFLYALSQAPIFKNILKGAFSCSG